MMFDLHVPESLAYLPGRVHVLSDYADAPRKPGKPTIEQKRARDRAYYARHRKAILARRRARYVPKPRKAVTMPRREQMAEYYRTHREEIAAQRKAKRAALRAKA